jgi:hypothetical protein
MNKNDKNRVKTNLYSILTDYKLKIKKQPLKSAFNIVMQTPAFAASTKWLKRK